MNLDILIWPVIFSMVSFTILSYQKRHHKFELEKFQIQLRINSMNDLEKLRKEVEELKVRINSIAAKAAFK